MSKRHKWSKATGSVERGTWKRKCKHCGWVERAGQRGPKGGIKVHYELGGNTCQCLPWCEVAP